MKPWADTERYFNLLDTEAERCFIPMHTDAEHCLIPMRGDAEPCFSPLQTGGPLSRPPSQSQRQAHPDNLRSRLSLECLH